MIERVVVLCGDEGQRVDGIRDYSKRLSASLATRSEVVDLRVPTPASVWRGASTWLGLWRRLRGAGRETGIALQYMPFCFGRWGFAPWLPACLLAIRIGRNRPLIAIMVHEPMSR